MIISIAIVALIVLVIDDIVLNVIIVDVIMTNDFFRITSSRDVESPLSRSASRANWTCSN